MSKRKTKFKCSLQAVHVQKEENSQTLVTYLCFPYSLSSLNVLIFLGVNLMHHHVYPFVELIL